MSIFIPIWTIDYRLNKLLGSFITHWNALDKDTVAPTKLIINSDPTSTDHVHYPNSGTKKTYKSFFSKQNNIFKMPNTRDSSTSGRLYEYKLVWIEEEMSSPTITLKCQQYTTPGGKSGKRKVHLPNEWDETPPGTYDWSMDMDTYVKLLKYVCRNF
jgi:3',5'-cyclic AMP phosphodiesterase CpdA